MLFLSYELWLVVLDVDAISKMVSMENVFVYVMLSQGDPFGRIHDNDTP